MNNNDPQQQQMIRDAMKAIAERRPGRTKLVYNKAKRTIEAVAENEQTPRALNITADDADMFAILTVSSRWLQERWAQLTQDRILPVRLSSWDDGDALTQCELGPQPSCSIVEGAVVLGEEFVTSGPSHLCIMLTGINDSTSDLSIFYGPDGSAHTAVARRESNGQQELLDVNFVDVQPELATRRASILETSLLSDKTVLYFGVGTGGSHAAIELAKSGVGRFILLDPDRLSTGNVVRHPGGVSQVGRLKVNVVRDLILEKNPDAQVLVHPIAISYDNVEAIRPLVAQADLVICGTDNRPSKLLINKICIDENVVAVYGGAFRRAYGGQVLRVRPRQSPCHECFVAGMPDAADDVEVSSTHAAAGIAYSDRPVSVEPGLSLDVLPLANMLTKLALIELLADKSTSLSILKRDYDAPWYLWLNRPEPGTQYANLPPLSESSDEMTINRWYGIYFDRDSGCSACGDFLTSVAASYGVNLSSFELPSLDSKE